MISNESKIQLSETELALACNAAIILTKNAVMQKTVLLFQQLQHQMQSHQLPYGMDKPPKISRGENYLGLPYIMLDYPRIANRNDLFFIRTFFWWGNFFSSTLHVAGLYKQIWKPLALSNLQSFAGLQYYIGINSDPWQHHFKKDNYQPLATYTPQQLSMQMDKTEHLKIAKTFALQDWIQTGEALMDSWKLFMQKLK